MKDGARFLAMKFEEHTGIDFLRHGALLTIAGSRAYNTHNFESDWDYFGVVASPVDNVLGLVAFEAWEPKAGTLPFDIDGKVFSLHKAVTLLLKGNPNTLEVLWYPKDVYELISPVGAELLLNRDMFSSKRAFVSLAGYARGQLRAMMRGTAGSRVGEKRRTLIETHGYDLKNASHLIRLLQLGIDLAKTGELQPWLEGAMRERVIGIKEGHWALHDVQDLADELFRYAEHAFATSSLPDEPDQDMVEELLIRLQWASFRQ